jgi:hypothetical protein
MLEAINVELKLCSKDRQGKEKEGRMADRRHECALYSLKSTRISYPEMQKAAISAWRWLEAF